MIPVAGANPFSDGFDAGYGFLGVTRLAPYGASGLPYGDFTGKVETVIVTPAAGPAGAGFHKASKRKRKGYPRRVIIDGRAYVVQSYEEEQQLLLEWRDRLEREALMLALENAPPAKIAKAKAKVIRAERRLDEVEDRAEDWLQRLRDEDEEILMMLH